MRAVLVCTLLCALLMASHAMTLEEAVTMSDQEFAAQIDSVASKLESTLQQYQQVMAIKQAMMEGKIPHSDNLEAALEVAQSKFSALQNTVSNVQEVIQHRQLAQQQPLSAVFTQAMADYARVLDVEKQIVAGTIQSSPQLLAAIATAKAKFQHLESITKSFEKAEPQVVAAHVQAQAHPQASVAQSHYAAAAPRASASAQRFSRRVVRQAAPQPTKPFNLDAWIQANLPKTTLNQPVNAVYSHWADLQVGNLPMSGNAREVALQMEYINALKRFGKISYTMPAPHFPKEALKTPEIKLMPPLRSYDDPELAPLGIPIMGGGPKTAESAVVPAMLEEQSSSEPSADEQLSGALASYESSIESQGHRAIDAVEAIMARPTAEVKETVAVPRPVAEAHKPSFGRKTPTIALLEEDSPAAMEELAQLQAQSEADMNLQGRASVEAVEVILARSESQ